MSAARLGTATLLGNWEPGSPQWHTARTGRLGASEIAAVLGLSPWQSPYSLWHHKNGNLPPQPGRPEMEWGRDMEDLIARRFARNHTADGWKLRRTGIYANRDRPWQAAQPDRTIHYGNHQMGCLEIKTDRYSDHWGDPGTGDIPIAYRCQGTWQMDTFGWGTCRFAVLITGVDYREYFIPYDPHDAELLRAAATQFLDSLTTGTPPPIDGHNATYRAIRDLHPSIDGTDIEIPPELATAYQEAVRIHHDATQLKQCTAARLLHTMGNARRAVCDGTRIAIRVPGKGTSPPHLRPARDTTKETT